MVGKDYSRTFTLHNLVAPNIVSHRKPHYKQSSRRMQLGCANVVVMKVQNITNNGQNARFWVLHRNSWVKVTLSPERRLTYGFSQRDDEGFRFEGTTLSLNDGIVLREWTYGGRDCDGFIRTDGADSCPLQYLRTVPAYPDTDRSSYFQGALIYRPHWQEHCASHTFDQTAQLANY